uniref:Carcinoembryonic antigen-related cell adhesion molecule 19 like gene M n=1 Tax=Xenopus tropicalis TaxID=8364 RepID=A0A803J211_XENTR
MTPGPQYFHRASQFPNGSLQISSLIPTDQGNFALMMLTAQGLAKVYIYLPVHEPVTKPVINSSSSQVLVNGNLTLTCVTVHAERILWRKDDNGLPSRVDFSPDNKTAIFHRINQWDAGQYQCEAENPISRSYSDVFTLTVSYRESYSGNRFISMAGIICGCIAGTALIIAAMVLLYKRYVLPLRDSQKDTHSVGRYTDRYSSTQGQSIDGREDPSMIYANVVNSDMGHMDLS